MEQLLTVADAARMLGVVPATVRQMERNGHLTAQRTASGMRLFRREDVEQLVETRAKARRNQEGISAATDQQDDAR